MEENLGELEMMDKAKAEEAKEAEENKILETLCETCDHKDDCLVRREESEPAILEAQWLLCHETLLRQDYHSDEQWNGEFISGGETDEANIQG
jgi:hypothetical protein